MTTHLDIVFESSTCVMEYPFIIVQWIMNSRIFRTKGQIMDNMTDVNMA